jgi:hypothetical protein
MGSFPGAHINDGNYSAQPVKVRWIIWRGFFAFRAWGSSSVATPLLGRIIAAELVGRFCTDLCA